MIGPEMSGSWKMFCRPLLLRRTQTPSPTKTFPSFSESEAVPYVLPRTNDELKRLKKELR